jgi:ketosteroid isomerase-like protein
MTLTPAELASALSGHRFAEVIPYLHDDVEWDLVGQGVLEGRDAIVDALENTERELADTKTEFTRFLVVAEGAAAVVDAIAEYTTAAGEQSFVASCDVYEFRDGKIARVRSYNVELDEGHRGYTGG